METNQFSTFWIDNKLYGVDIKMVQEITKSMSMTTVPLAPDYIKGLINLRGQISTAIGLRELLKIPNRDISHGEINVVCKDDSYLLSLIADEVGDVLELENSMFESTPETLSRDVSKFMNGVYKLQDGILSILDIKKIISFLND